MNSRDKLHDHLSSVPEGEELSKLILDLVGKGREQDWLLLRVILQDAKNQRQLSLHSPGVMNDSEQAVLDIIQRGKPVTAEEMALEAASRPDTPKTVMHRSGASATLNSLIGKGLVAKFPYGRGVVFTTPREAIFESYKIWLTDQSSQNISRRLSEVDPFAISEMTGLPVTTIIEELGSMLGA